MAIKAGLRTTNRLTHTVSGLDRKRHMALELKQDSEYKGKDWWKWSVWIDGSEQELDQIRYVEYTLHHTFPRPVRKIANRSSRFRLDAHGWGTFTIYAKAVHKDG